MTRTTLLALTVTALSVSLPATLAAQTVAPDRTGTGGGPTSTITAPYTNSLGVTKVPGTSLGAGEVPSRRDAQRERALTNGIDSSICDGCN